LHASFELKQRVNGFQPILDDGPQLFPAAFAGVYDLPQRNRLAGQIGRDGSAKEPITVEDANFAHVPRIEANRYLFTDISCERERQVAEGMKVNAVWPDLARTDLVDQQKVQPFYAVGHAWQEATLFPSLFGGQFAF